MPIAVSDAFTSTQRDQSLRKILIKVLMRELLHGATEHSDLSVLIPSLFLVIPGCILLHLYASLCFEQIIVMYFV